VKPYTLTFAPVVNKQIDEQVLFIAQDSIDHALAWEDRLRDTIAGLSSFRGYAVDEEASDRLGYKLHKIVFEGNYLIHYAVDEKARAVRIVNFRHGARLPKDGEP
jgi:plasmid stabilization system protein ParE